VNEIDDVWAADLVEMQEWSKVNKGYRYILNVIDCFSKYAWGIPLKD
jgi:transposase InsO family protein